jgi:hypothetical protein
MTKKLHLDIDALRISSFVVETGDKRIGTVHAHESVYQTFECPDLSVGCTNGESFNCTLECSRIGSCAQTICDNIH